MATWPFLEYPGLPMIQQLKCLLLTQPGASRPCITTAARIPSDWLVSALLPFVNCFDVTWSLKVPTRNKWLKLGRKNLKGGNTRIKGKMKRHRKGVFVHMRFTNRARNLDPKAAICWIYDVSKFRIYHGQGEWNELWRRETERRVGLARCVCYVAWSLNLIKWQLITPVHLTEH